MQRFLFPAGTLALAAVAPGVASAKPPTTAHARAYQRAYHQVAHHLGRRVPGRNIIKDGVGPGRRATDAESVRSLHVLERMLALRSASTITSTSASPPASSSTGAAVPACASESGSDYSTGASNTNASSGATGRYQITPSTAAAYGCDLSTPAGQDACAETIYQHQGAGAWVGCGG
jgi:transglycosylase-like protein